MYKYLKKQNGNYMRRTKDFSDTLRGALLKYHWPGLSRDFSFAKRSLRRYVYLTHHFFPGINSFF